MAHDPAPTSDGLIYLDHHATTPCDPAVVAAMLPFFTSQFGNPHSADHRAGWAASDAVEAARSQIAAAIGARPPEIIFTSGATEANNLAIKGAARYRLAKEGRRKIVTLASEHKCVLESVKSLRAEGFECIILPIQPDGLVDLELLAATLDDQTALLSVMAVNNEIGVIQPLAAIGALARARDIWFHCDAAQGLGRIALDVAALPIDLMSLSGHKIYGPKGVGALYLRGRAPKVALAPLFSGGGQERGLRPGTLSPALCVGMGVAAELATARLQQDAAHLALLRDRLWAGLQQISNRISVNGCLEQRVAGNLNVTIPDIEPAEILAGLGPLCLSTGSACSSAAQQYSHVLQALGHDPGQVATALRFGLGRQTTAAEIDQSIDLLRRLLLRATSCG